MATESVYPSTPTQQTPPPAGAPSVPPAFRRTPINPHGEKVKQGLEQLQSQPPVAPTASAAPVAAPTVEPSVTPAAQQPALAAPPQQNIAPQPIPQQPTAQYDPRVLAALQQSESERIRLAEEYATAQQTINNLLTAQAELEQLKQRQALQDSLSADAFADLEVVDPADAKRIANAVLNATTPALTSIQQELAKTRQQLAESQNQVQSQLQQSRAQQTLQRIQAAHPDFVALQQTPQYHMFMNQRDGLSSQTRDARAAQEFNAGNADYIIDMLNQLKGSTPSVNQITSVAPVQSATTVSTANAEPAAPTLTLRELNNLYQTKQITRDEYLAKVDAARAALYA